MDFLLILNYIEKYGDPEDDEGNWNPQWTRPNLREMKEEILSFLKEKLKNCPSPTSSISSAASKKSRKKE